MLIVLNTTRMKPKIWLSSPHMGGNETKYVQEAFDTNWVAPLGPNVDGFEKDLENFLGNTVQAAALSSGTAALHLALVLLNVKQGDEVLCQSMTFAASANPITYQGATPVFVDSENDTWNISPSSLILAIEDRIAKGKKPKAIIVVHLYGMPANMDAIMDISTHYGIPVIEDAAEALGSTYKGRALGTIGDIGIFSFNGNKIITTSGGGALVSKDTNVIRKARFLATQALDPAPHYQHSSIGYNYRMSNIAAGIGRGQMEVLALRVAQRRANFEFYSKAFEGIDAISMGAAPSTDYYSNHWLSVILLDPKKINREEVRLALTAENIDCRPLWKPMHMQPVFADTTFFGNGTSERLFENGLCLPSGSNLTREELEKVAEIVVAICSRKVRNIKKKVTAQRA
jgi:dTDP-4-amino-4,6-dideoxygalactose transaminase